MRSGKGADGQLTLTQMENPAVEISGAFRVSGGDTTGNALFGRLAR